MNTKYLTTLTLVATFLFAGQSYAQDKSTQSDEVKTTPTIVQPRDAASGLPTGKRQHKPINTTKPLDKSSPILLESPNLNNQKSAYRKCPDGTMINPGEKCPEKNVRAGYKLCPDGTMINPGEKCPEKADRTF